MKKFFDEPRLETEAFVASDSILSLSSGFELGEDELNPVSE